MDNKEIIQEITEVFIEVLDNEDIVLDNETTANDVEDWDSLSHIMLVVAVEKHFGVRFTSKEIQSWKNVGEMISCIQSKNA